MEHEFSFDPTYGYDLPALLAVGCPDEPADLEQFWRATFAEAQSVAPNITMRQVSGGSDELDVHEIEFDALGGFRTGGWLTVPRRGAVRRGVVMGHGYGGRDAPQLDIPGPPCVTIQPCARGFHRSARSDLPDTADRHVLHGIESRETYLHLGSVGDYWAAAGALLELFPEVGACLDYHGGSFGGGIGAMMLPWDHRFRRAFLSVPSFGNHPLRVTLPCVGSGHHVRQHYQQHPQVLEVLKYFDAAVHARRINIPVLFSCALFDPAVPPPGQFAVHNALPGDKQLHVAQAGHFEYDATGDNDRLRQMQEAWFAL
jgi:cephalosporin-C deacetylase